MKKEKQTPAVEETEIEIQDTAAKKKIFWKEVRSYAILTMVAIAIAWTLSHKIIVNAEVPTTSMEATVMRQDRIIVNRLAYTWSKPERGDIVMFKFPDDETQDYLKRVIGLPGESVEIIGGAVYINGTYLEENYLREEPVPEDAGPFLVPEGCYFMMGDNRNISLDSRYWENHFVSENKIIGKAVIIYYPRWKTLD